AGRGNFAAGSTELRESEAIGDRLCRARRRSVSRARLAGMDRRSTRRWQLRCQGRSLVHCLWLRRQRGKRASACRAESRDDSRHHQREPRMSASPTLSVNARAAQLVERIKEASAELKIAVARGELGETLIDAGSR